MSRTLDAYTTNDYTIISNPDGSFIAWKYHKGNDLSQDGCLYARKFKLDTNDAIFESIIKLITLETTEFTALQDDNAIADFIIQEHRSN